MGARFKSDIHLRSSGLNTSLSKSHDFGMGLAGSLSVAFTDNAAILHDDCPYRRIGTGDPDRLASEIDGARHRVVGERFLRGRHVVDFIESSVWFQR